MKLKLYVVTEVVSGEGRCDYIPEPYTLGVFTERGAAITTMANRKAEIEREYSEDELSVDDCTDNGRESCTIVDCDEDWCRVMKISEEEITV